MVPKPLIGLVPVLDANGQTNRFDFEISEQVQTQTDGATTDTLSVGFSVPSAPAIASLNIPLLSLSPSYSSSGGALESGSTYYYASARLILRATKGRFRSPPRSPCARTKNKYGDRQPAKLPLK